MTARSFATTSAALAPAKSAANEFGRCISRNRLRSMAASTLVESDQLEIAENAMTSLEVPPVARPNETSMRIADRFEAESGRLYLNGMQALVRFPLVQAKADRAAG